ncbi:MAG: FG-GAP repeat domain-containing protein [Planctomycetota bacterium]
MRLQFPTVVLALLAPPALAQTFTLQVGAVPGQTPSAPNTEGAILADVDGDGDLDVVCANGSGSPAQQQLFINNYPTGLVDESVARLGVLSLAGAMVIAADLDDDLDQDLVFAVRNGQAPRLLLNNGSGIFTNTPANMPATGISAWGIAVGDVDNDGDIDLAFSNTSTGVARLYLNGGAAFFTDATSTGFAGLPAAVDPQDCTFVDVDRDLDLDFVATNRGFIPPGNNQLFLNNGSGVFSNASALLPADGNAYETEWADCDNDGDVDAFYQSLSPGSFNEGYVRNNLVPNGTLTFTALPGNVTGTNGFDDNEIAFVDHDNDGDLDAIVGSLGAAQERLYLNNGAGVFSYVASGFTSVTDSTLDVAVGDVNGDGKPDAYTAQGESGAFTDRLYFGNTAAVDTLPPVLSQVQAVAASPSTSGPWVFRAAIRDGIYDDGVTYVSAVANYTVNAPNGAFPGSVAMKDVGGGLHRGAMTNPGGAAAVGPGTTVVYSVTATDREGNFAASSTNTLTVCGSEAYDSAVPSLTSIATVPSGGSVGGNLTLTTSGAPLSAPGILFFSLGAADVPLSPTGAALVDPTLLAAWIFLSTDPAGGNVTVIPIPPNPAFALATVYLQEFVVDLGTMIVEAGNGVKVVLCP